MTFGALRKRRYKIARSGQHARGWGVGYLSLGCLCCPIFIGQTSTGKPPHAMQINHGDPFSNNEAGYCQVGVQNRATKSRIRARDDS